MKNGEKRNTFKLGVCLNEIELSILRETLIRSRVAPAGNHPKNVGKRAPSVSGTDPAVILLGETASLPVDQRGGHLVRSTARR